jgi:hypothetical protein
MDSQQKVMAQGLDAGLPSEGNGDMPVHDVPSAVDYDSDASMLDDVLEGRAPMNISHAGGEFSAVVDSMYKTSRYVQIISAVPLY